MDGRNPRRNSRAASGARREPLGQLALALALTAVLARGSGAAAEEVHWGASPPLPPPVVLGNAVGEAAFWGVAPNPYPAPPAHQVVRAPADPRAAHLPIATIPGAAAAPVWRSPYAYGYFGAAPRSHWFRHFGYRQSYTQWTRR